MADRKSKSRAQKQGAIAGLKDELAQSEALFRWVLETSVSPVLILGADLTVQEMNASAEQFYDLKRADVLGRTFFDALDPQRCSGFQEENWHRVLGGEPLQGFEGRILHPSGSEYILLWNALRFFDDRAEEFRIFARAQDITERQRAEKELREREARLSSIIETAPDAIITIDEHGIVQSFSAAAEKMFGYDAGEVIGRNVNILMPTPHHERHDAYLLHYLTTGEKRIIGIGRKVEAKRKDGTVFPMELAVGEAVAHNSRIFTGFIRDISARTKMEEQLRQSQKMEAVGQLTGGLAHDFNNLLTVISGNLEMLEARLTEPMQLDLLNEAQEAARLGAQLASRLLAFGRRQPLNPKPTDLNALVNGIGDLLRRSLGESIRIETKLSTDLPMTLADHGQVENALLNLAINARDAMPNGGQLVVETGSMHIGPEDKSVFPEVDSGQYVALSVTDTGIGMPPEIQRRVFEPFFTTKSPGQGTGLGLSMVYGFVKQSGGYIHLYSEPGTGTTVRIYLPATADQAGTRSDTKHRVTLGRGETILLVEDDDRVRRISLRRLEELGYTAIEEVSGMAALERIVQGEMIDLLFTDIVMPGLSGLDLAHAARQHRPDLRVLFTSGYAEPALTKGEILTDNADWLSKPYTTADLAIKLRQLLDN